MKRWLKGLSDPLDINLNVRILTVVTNAIKLQLDQLGMGANVYLTYPITEFFLLVVSSHDQNSASSLDVFVDSVHFR